MAFTEGISEEVVRVWSVLSSEMEEEWRARGLGGCRLQERRGLARGEEECSN